MSTHQELAGFIWSVADLLRGDYKQSEYGKVILPFTVLRRLECVLEPTREKVAEIAEQHKDSGIDPDRFLPERSAGRSRWQFLPFGGGSRSCIGEHFAIVEATLAVAAVVRRVRLDGHTEVFPHGLGFTAFADGPVRAGVRAR